MPIELPDDRTRWRCARCGNLTRFDVTRTTRVREYWHLDLAGDATVEQSEAVAAAVERVACRWCGADDAVELVARPDAGGPTAETTSGS